jgi:hypothetical protein
VLPKDDQDDENVAHMIAQEPRLATAVCKMRVVELVWLFDNFCLRGYELHFSPLHGKRQLAAYHRQRIHDKALTFMCLGCGPDERKLLPDDCTSCH